MSEDIKEKPWQVRLLTASALAQKSLKANAKGYNFKYCPLPQVLRIGRKIFHEHGLALIQETNNVEHKTLIETKIWDLWSQEGALAVLSSEIAVPTITPDIKEISYELKGRQIKEKTTENINHAVGAAITYTRRYALFCVMNIYPEEDSCGEWKPRDNTRTPQWSKK